MESRLPVIQSAINGNNVTLFVISPQAISMQVIRPYTYEFNEAFVNHLLENNFKSESVGFTPLAKKESNMLSGIIKPSGTGIPVSTRALSNTWKFRLVIDMMVRNGNRVRIIANGWFDQEPIAPTTLHNVNPVLNPQANLYFTNCNTFDLKSRTTHSPCFGLSARENTCLTPSGLLLHEIGEGFTELGQPNPQLDYYFSEPKNLSDQDFESDVQDGFPTSNEFDCIGNYSLHTDTSQRAFRPTTAALKSPKRQLRKVVRALESAVMAHGCTNGLAPLASDDGYTDPDKSFKQTFRSNLTAGCDMMFANGGLDFSRPISLHELNRRFQRCDVRPIVVPQTPSWDPRPQSVFTPQNTFSYLIAQIVETACFSESISQITFRYNSEAGRMTMQEDPGVWQIDSMAVYIEIPQTMLGAILGKFRIIMETDLFPVITSSVGAFDLMVHYNTSQTIVKLNLIDIVDGNEGVFEYANTIGGMILPTVSSREVLENNLEQLVTLETIAKRTCTDISDDIYAQHYQLDDVVEQNAGNLSVASVNPALPQDSLNWEAIKGAPVMAPPPKPKPQKSNGVDMMDFLDR